MGRNILERDSVMPAKLSVNLNAVALLRNRRNLPWPSVTGIGRLALQAGACGLTVHPRPDQRHIRFSDLPDIRNLLDDEFPGREFNIEGFPSEEFLALVETAQPEQVTLVPDSPEQNTSDHGWNFSQNRDLLRRVISRLKKSGFRVSCFVDPDASLEELTIAKELGADRVELYTGPYGACHDDPARAKAELEKLGDTARRAESLGLEINAGHDLTVENLPDLVKHLPMLAEVSIGHALTADALIYGISETVRRYNRALGW